MYRKYLLFIINLQKNNHIFNTIPLKIFRSYIQLNKWSILEINNTFIYNVWLIRPPASRDAVQFRFLVVPRFLSHGWVASTNLRHANRLSHRLSNPSSCLFHCHRPLFICPLSFRSIPRLISSFSSNSCFNCLPHGHCPPRLSCLFSYLSAPLPAPMGDRPEAFGLL